MISGRYFWIPVQNIRQVKIEPPTDLRDLVWLPVHFTWTNGGEAVGLIPTRYTGSESSSDNLIRLARKTTWREPVAGCSFGLGQRMLSTEELDLPLLDVRRIDLVWYRRGVPRGAVCGRRRPGSGVVHGRTHRQRAAPTFAPRPPDRRRAGEEAWNRGIAA